MSDLEIKPHVPPEWKTISNEALCKLAQAGIGHAMDVLIWRNEAFLAERARKVWNKAFKNTQEYSVDLDDLMQAAREGMWKAIIAFKPSYGTKLLTLAGKCIENKLADLEREYFSDIKEENEGFREEDKQEEEEPPHINLRLRPDEYKKRPEPMALARETSEEICRSVNSLEPREKKYLCYRFGYPFDDDVPQRKAAEHFLITRTRADELEQEALRHFKTGLHWDTLDYWIDVEHDQQ